jgi:acyl carrier protein
MTDNIADTLDMPDITSRILTILSVYSGIDIDSITCIDGPNTTISSLNFDSLGMVEVVQELEKEFSIDISDSDVERLVTVGELVEHIARKIAIPIPAPTSTVIEDEK